MSTDPPPGDDRQADKSPTKKAATEKKAASKGPAKKAATKKTATKKTTAPKTTTKRATTKKTDAGTPTSGILDAPEEVMRSASSIIDVFESRPDLLLAAFANPVRALRDAGIRLSPEAERWVALRCRFSPDEIEELDYLAGQVREHLGDIDPDDDTEVRRALRDAGVEIPLGARKTSEAAASPIGKGSASSDRKAALKQTERTGRAKELHPVRRSVLLAAEQVQQVHRWRETRRADRLDEYADAHAVMAPLLEYRRRSAARPKFASDDLYERLAATKGGQLASGINVEFHVRLSDDRSG